MILQEVFLGIKNCCNMKMREKKKHHWPIPVVDLLDYQVVNHGFSVLRKTSNVNTREKKENNNWEALNLVTSVTPAWGVSFNRGLAPSAFKHPVFSGNSLPGVQIAVVANPHSMIVRCGCDVNAMRKRPLWTNTKPFRMWGVSNTKTLDLSDC